MVKGWKSERAEWLTGGTVEGLKGGTFHFKDIGVFSNLGEGDGTASPRGRGVGLLKNDIAIRADNGHFLRPGSGRSVAWLARLVRVQEVVSSNLTAPTTFSP